MGFWPMSYFNEEVAKTIELIENLESLKDVSALTSLLRCAEAAR